MKNRREAALHEIRYVKPGTLRKGDTIRVAWKQGDLESTRVGVIDTVTDWTNLTEYRTANGYVLVETFGDGTTEPRDARVTLLERHKTPQPGDVVQPTLDFAV